MTGACTARIPGVCSGLAEHGHHRQLRRHGNDTPLNVIPVCARCHNAIHHRPAWSTSWGLLVPSWADPADIHPHELPDPANPGPYADPAPT